MSINSKGKLLSEYVPDLKVSDYEFNRFDKAALKSSVSVLKLLVGNISYSGWREAATLFFNNIAEIFLTKGYDVHCFIASPAWKKDSRIVRHYGLGRGLGKDSEVELLDFLFEKEITSDGYVIFYGVVKLTSVNAISIFKLLSENENGVLFASRDAGDPNFCSLVVDLATLVSIKSKSLTFSLNIVEAINFILNKNMEAIFPYAWEETGEYHLDIFEGARVERAGLHGYQYLRS